MKKSLVWLRRDIRVTDHTALSAACAESDEVNLVFIFDQKILEKLDKQDKRVTFIHDSIKELHHDLDKAGGGINIYFGDPVEIITSLAKKLKVGKVFFNRDYEAYALNRDKAVTKSLKNNDIDVATFRDHIVFEPKEVLKKDKTPYKVFTPFKRAWIERFKEEFSRGKSFKIDLKKISSSVQSDFTSNNWMKKMGFEHQELLIPAGRSGALKTMKNFQKHIIDYHKTRDLLEKNSTSGLSPYIRHGLLSIREVLNLGLKDNLIVHDTFISEIIWREFYQMILSNFPVVEKKSFKPQYDEIVWQGGAKEFNAWKNGQTGFPIIDAAMRCLNDTGLMPNRLRMVTASFLCKTLLVDWKKGERYFADKLLDYDLASNNGGWQWSSSSGCDSQPYFRIFNPLSQSQKFDPKGKFIRRWCPELFDLDDKQIHQPHAYGPLFLVEKSIEYPAPVVDYAQKRVEALDMYKTALK